MDRRLPLVLLVLSLLALLVSCGAPATESPAAAAPPPPPVPSKYVVLTFDDGPDPKYTPQILDILETYDAKATFFALGREVAANPELTLDAHERGHSVQNHTWSHPDLRKLSAASFKSQVEKTDRSIREQTDSTPNCLRPPYGAVNSLVTQRAAALGKKLMTWTVDSRDWTRPGQAAIVRRVLAEVRSGSVILFHDGGGDRRQTLAALPTILKTLKDRGYGFRPACG
ncbi:hypothetical protein GCM10009789_44930 [Kribbella sancticallisti]|uniref:NodB homology domain-containing protein n=1 Tax=Kribbella sancticallisti TaxID=460087 RepID=A0ABP4PN47_9ACTN